MQINQTTIVFPGFNTTSTYELPEPLYGVTEEELMQEVIDHYKTEGVDEEELQHLVDDPSTAIQCYFDYVLNLFPYVEGYD